MKRNLGILNIDSALMVPEIRLIEIFYLIEFLPLRINSNVYMDTLMYCGSSTKFRPISEGTRCPKYSLKITTDEVNWPIKVDVIEEAH